MEQHVCTYIHLSLCIDHSTTRILRFCLRSICSSVFCMVYMYVHTLKQEVLFQILVNLIKVDLLDNMTIMSPEFFLFRVYIE